MLSVKYNLYSHRSFPLCFKEGESFIVTPGFTQLETKVKIKDDDVILLKLAHRFGPGEIEKIIDDAIARKGRHPLEYYFLLDDRLLIARSHTPMH